MLITQVSFGQFQVNSKINFHPTMLLPAHFNTLDLKPFTGIASEFDIKNPYTTLITLKDKDHVYYQMVIQTSFMGNLQYAGMSLNMWMLFNKSNKPMFAFQNCMKSISDIFNFAYPIDQLTDCIVARLNYCDQ